uniref:Gag-polypeptide of LTR copia-type n=1 Tax=Tanacetum cinerariifolium TaxID=118510 RepID=A0A699I981_TANCI|nr:Gag-polypeptide of LTR copia-type [Tanacetum cinerariifolium]
MEKGIRVNVKYANTSSEIRSNLKERFGKESAPRAYELKKKITATRQEGNSVSTYYTRLKSLWDESHSIFFPCCSCNKCTCELGKKITAHLEKQKLYEFLMRLDSDFNVIRTHILATKPVPTLRTAYHMIAEDERQRAISLENQAVPEPTAFKAFQRRASYEELDWIDFFKQATQDEKWQNDMQQEIKALKKNETWTLEDLREGKRAIDSKWVHKTKFKSDGEVERYKARHIAKGCIQREGVDYHEKFVSVAKLVTVRTLLVVATKKVGSSINWMSTTHSYMEI